MRRSIVLSASLLAALAANNAGARSNVTFATDIPFRDCDGLICIDVALDGATRTLLLDTGNIRSTMIADVARDLGWKLDPVERDGAAVPGIFRGGDHHTALGDLIDTTSFFVFERSLLGEYKLPADGSIAYTWFKDRVLQIDYPRHRLRISHVQTTPVSSPPEGVGSLKLITFGEHGPPIVVGSPFTIDGKSVRAQIDTVFTGTMLVYDDALDALGLKKSGAPELFRYTDGGVNLSGAPAGAFGFKGRAIAPAKSTVYFVADGKNPVHQPEGLFEATVGNALFAHSVVTMDFHAMTLDVEPSKDQ